MTVQINRDGDDLQRAIYAKTLFMPSRTSDDLTHSELRIYSEGGNRWEFGIFILCFLFYLRLAILSKTHPTTVASND